MKKKGTVLRKLAEEMLSKSNLKNENMSQMQTENLLHELQVHQLELEMKNDELRTTHLSLEISLEKYNNFYNLAPFCYITSNSNGIIANANITASEMFEIPIENLIGKPFTDLIVKEDLDQYYLVHKNLGETGTKQQFEIRLKRQNSSSFSANVGIKRIQFNEDYEDGIAFGDISKRIEAEHENNKFLKVMQQSSTSIFITNAVGNIEYVNPKFTEVSGYSSHEVIGKNPRFMKSGEQSKAFYKDLWDTILKGNTWTGILHNKKKNGELFWEQNIISSVKDAEGKITNFVAIKEDITEKVKKDLELKKYREHLEELVTLRTQEQEVVNNELIAQVEKGKQLEIQLVESLSKEKEVNELKSKFIETVSHEFRTPMTILFSSAEMIQKYATKWSAEKLNTHFGRIKKSVENITQLLNDVLTINKADREISINMPNSVHIENLVQSIFEQLRSKLTVNHKLIFINNINNETIEVDRKLLSYILVNLLTNAIKYSPKGGKVKLTISSENEEIKITVSDNGLGIAEDEIKYIFDAFYKCRNSIGIKGSGVGLNIVRRSTLALGGNVFVESKINEGTTFTLIIPSNN